MYLNIRTIFTRLSENKLIQALRDGLVAIIPVVMAGSFALTFKTLPIKAYQNFIHAVGGGFLVDIFSLIYSATFGMLSVYMVISVSYKISKALYGAAGSFQGAPIAALGCFSVLSGVFVPGGSFEAFGPTGINAALFSAIVGTVLYHKLLEKQKIGHRLFADGADVEFNSALSVILVVAAVIFICAAFNYLIVKLFDVSGLSELVSNILRDIFSHMGRTLPTSLLFMLLLNIMWTLGIHGNNMLEAVTQSLFIPAMAINQVAVADGKVPTEIFSKTFLDTFVLMGGCGATLSLLAAVLLFSKRRSNRRLSQFAAFPMLFNVNELMVYGLPVVFNPVLFIPFVGTPMVMLLTSYIAMRSGLVPLAAYPVAWTTPIIFSGYVVTGSIRGSLLQLFNLVLGALIYKPFVQLYDSEKLYNTESVTNGLTELVKKCERENASVTLTELEDSKGGMARMLVEDLKYAIEANQLTLYYQPQHDASGRCFGVEGLLRWDHPIAGMLYPPLVIRIAEESGLLGQLEQQTVRHVLRDAKDIVRLLGPDAKISVNVSGKTIQSEQFENFLNTICAEYDLNRYHICLEVTEQRALLLDRAGEERFARIRNMGFKLAIDDFSMGHTSIKYLEGSSFDIVKLDGSLVKELQYNSRVGEIISSIVGLSDSLGVSVLAEYVETEQQREMLERLGCTNYQGYLYSPAIPIDQLEKYVQKMATKQAESQNMHGETR